MKPSGRILSIFLLLLVLVFAPVLAAGYWELALAQSATAPLERSVHFQLAAERLPWRADLYESAGLAALDAREYPRAIDLFRAAGRSAALSPTGGLALGQALLSAGDPQGALAEWNSLLDNAQARGQASRLLADLDHGRARFVDEQRILEAWLRFDPGNPDASYRLGLLLFAQASPQALPLLEVAAADGPASLKPHVEGLISTLKTARSQPTRSQALVVCGRTLAALGEWQLAGQSFQTATQADSSNGLAWAWLGEAAQHTGSPAADAFARALAEMPASAEVHAMAGLYWQRRQDWQKALVEFSAAARLEPHNQVWQISLGDVYTHLGDLVKALGCYQTATDLAPADPQTWGALALFSVENGVDIGGVGRDAALQAYALQPVSPQNLDTLGRVMMDTAQWDTAEVFLKRAIAAGPDQAAPRFHLGLLYLQTDKPDLARQYLQSAQALDPDGPIGTQAAAALARYLP